MSQLIDLSGPQLERALGRVVAPMELVIAKNLALGVSREQLCDILGNGISVDEITELQESESFQELYGIIANHLLEQSADTAIGWDALEAISIRNLMREARVNRDPDFQLRLAAVANKAQRRHNKGEQVLEPGAAGTRVQINLSQRFIRKLNGETEITERRMDVTQIRNPSIDQVQRALNALPMDSAAGHRGAQYEPSEAQGERHVDVPAARVSADPRARAPSESLDADSALNAVLRAMGARP